MSFNSFLVLLFFKDFEMSPLLFYVIIRWYWNRIAND